VLPFDFVVVGGVELIRLCVAEAVRGAVRVNAKLPAAVGQREAGSIRRPHAVLDGVQLLHRRVLQWPVLRVVVRPRLDEPEASESET
jgi:hypothetical protein